MIDEPRDIAADCRVAAPDPIDSVDPDSTLLQIPHFARSAVLVPDQLTCVVDDALVLVDWLGGEHAEPVEPGTPADDARKGHGD